MEKITPSKITRLLDVSDDDDNSNQEQILVPESNYIEALALVTSVEKTPVKENKSRRDLVTHTPELPERIAAIHTISLTTDKTQDQNMDVSEDQEMVENQFVFAEPEDPMKQKQASEVNIRSKEGFNKYKNKSQRLKGQTYKGRRKENYSIDKPARKMGESCRSKFCAKACNRHCSSFSTEDRQLIFDTFWTKIEDWKTRRWYIASLIDSSETKEKTSKIPDKLSRRKFSYSYFLKKDDKRYQVCQTTFSNTFGILVHTINSWINIQAKETPPKIIENEEKVRRTTLKPRNIFMTNTQKKKLDKYLDSLPRVPSHYCRKNTSRFYLERPFRSQSQVYRLYEENCNSEGTKPVSWTSFWRAFKENKLAIFRPRKDRCNVCVGFECKNISKDEYDIHYAEQKEAQDEKDRD
ncbi:hypothetical protein B566_EDAN016117 [Ephemera danica]|nr:hypothetical protein B566_EDAN016117 [Ephemera danica]